MAHSSPINNIAQTFAHPQAIARRVVEEIEVSAKLAPSWHRDDRDSIPVPARSSCVELQHHIMAKSCRCVLRPQEMALSDQTYRPPPWLGEHSDDILQELGYGADQITELRRKGVI